MPLPESAAPEAQAAALGELKRRASEAGPSPLSRALDVLTEMLETGRLTAKGRRHPDTSLENIDPAEFAYLELNPPHARSRRDWEVVFYDLLISARDLIQSRACEPKDSSGKGRLCWALPRRPSGRNPAAYWGIARKAAMMWLEDNGYPQAGDGNQAQLEKYISDFLGKRGYYPAKSSVRRHVVEWIAEYRNSVTD